MAGSLMEALTEDERQALTGRAIRRRVPRGTTLFMEGHAVDRVGVILQGRVKVCHLTDDGQEIIGRCASRATSSGTWKRSPLGPPSQP
jgi:CRP-like cAMP-binding protein